MLHIIARRCSAIHTKPQHVRYLCAPKRAKFQPRPEVPRATPDIAAALLGPGPPLHSDKHVLCINKPGGLLTQPDFSGLHTATEAAKILYSDKHIEATHRLDKLASGCLLLARTPRAKSRLAEQFAAEAIHKNYLAVVSGRPLRPGEANFIATSMRKDWRGRVIVQQPQQPQQPSWDASHLDAGSGSTDGGKGGRRDRSKLRTTLLRWQVLATTGDVSLIVANPRGGHKHQVRAMLAYDGLPIVGDPVYGGERWEKEEPFLALHAVTLQCAHPIGGFEPLRLCAGVPRNTWMDRIPVDLVEAAEAAVASAMMGEDSPLWNAQPDASDEAFQHEPIRSRHLAYEEQDSSVSTSWHDASWTMSEHGSSASGGVSGRRRRRTRRRTSSSFKD